MKLPHRFILNSSLLIVFTILAYLVWKLCKIRLSATSIYSGAGLLGLTIFLALFNARKKLPFLPLLKASTWLQFHIYLGFFSVVLFLLHIDFRIPSGVLEIVLAVIFSIVAVSGMIGLFISRTLPKLMNQSGQPASYERIPQLRRQIRESVQVLVLKAEETCESSTLPEFYLEHLSSYLESRPSVYRSLNPSKRRLSHRLMNELEARLRYLSDEEKVIASEIEEWIATKENLDYQDASQRILKGWLFIHIPFTWSLILLGIAHGVFALLYAGNG